MLCPPYVHYIKGLATETAEIREEPYVGLIHKQFPGLGIIREKKLVEWKKHTAGKVKKTKDTPCDDVQLTW